MADLVINGRVIPAIHYDRELYCLNDIHKASEYGPSKRPANWVRTVSKKLSSYMSLESRKGGSNPGTYGNRKAVIAYAMWVDDDFYCAVLDTFDALTNSSIDAAVAASRRVFIEHTIRADAVGESWTAPVKKVRKLDDNIRSL